MKTLRLRCRCQRNLLDVEWDALDRFHDGGWVKVEPRPGVKWEPDRASRYRDPKSPEEANAALGIDWTHNVWCKCGQKHELAERIIAAEWVASNQPDSPDVVPVTIGLWSTPHGR